MSTPSGKPGNPIDLSAYESRKARERTAAAERHPDPLRSPYAPKRAHEPAGTKRHSVENDRDPLRSPYAPTKARGQPAIAPDFVIGDDAEPPAPMRAREGSRERPAAERHSLRTAEPHGYAYDTSGGAPALARPLFNDDDYSPKTTLEEGITGGHTVARDAAASFQPAHPSSGQHQPPTADRRDESMSDHNLKRLEASLRWLQRQETATRLPRATPLPPVPGLAPVDATGRRHSSEIVGRKPSGSALAGPPLAMRSRRDNLRWPLGIVVVIIFAAPIAYYLSVGGWVPPVLGPQIASFDQTIVAPQEHDPETSAPTEMSSERMGISQAAKSSEGETIAMLQGGITGAQAPSPGKANRALDREEINLLTKQGEQFAAAGDLVTARILFQRAAEAGDGNAAVALGGTYDPTELGKRGVVGMSADIAKARSWYQKAEKFGSPAARERLDALAGR